MKQGYNSRLDESLGSRNGKKSQSYKSRRNESKGMIGGQTNDEKNKLCKFHNIDRKFLDTYKGKQSKIKIIRNLVDYEAGKTILDTVMGLRIKQNVNQTELF